MATSGVALLKKAYPDAKITMLVVPRAAEVVRDNPLIDEVIVLDYKSKGFSLKNMLALVQDIKRRKFDLNVSFDYKLRPLLLAFFAGIGVRISGKDLYQQQPWWVKKMFTRLIPIPGQFDKNHQSETFQMIVRGFTGQDGQAMPSMPPVKPDNEKKAAQLLGRLPEGKRKVAFCVRGTHPEKNWPQDRFAKVMDRLTKEYDCACFIIGAPGDKDYADEVIAKCQSPVANFCGETSLPDLMALIKRADLFITVDTGAMHLAATTGIPMIAIFLCTNIVQWRPLNDNATVLCYERVRERFGINPDEYPNHIVKQEIDVEDVVEVVRTEVKHGAE